MFASVASLRTKIDRLEREIISGKGNSWRLWNALRAARAKLKKLQ